MSKMDSLLTQTEVLLEQYLLSLDGTYNATDVFNALSPLFLDPEDQLDDKVLGTLLSENIEWHRSSESCRVFANGLSMLCGTFPWKMNILIRILVHKICTGFSFSATYSHIESILAIFDALGQVLSLSPCVDLDFPELKEAILSYAEFALQKCAPSVTCWKVFLLLLLLRKLIDERPVGLWINLFYDLLLLIYRERQVIYPFASIRRPHIDKKSIDSMLLEAREWMTVTEEVCVRSTNENNVKLIECAVTLFGSWVTRWRFINASFSNFYAEIMNMLTVKSSWSLQQQKSIFLFQSSSDLIQNIETESFIDLYPLHLLISLVLIFATSVESFVTDCLLILDRIDLSDVNPCPFLYALTSIVGSGGDIVSSLCVEKTLISLLRYTKRHKISGNSVSDILKLILNSAIYIMLSRYHSMSTNLHSSKLQYLISKVFQSQNVHQLYEDIINPALGVYILIFLHQRFGYEFKMDTIQYLLHSLRKYQHVVYIQTFDSFSYDSIREVAPNFLDLIIGLSNRNLTTNSVLSDIIPPLETLGSATELSNHIQQFLMKIHKRNETKACSTGVISVMQVKDLCIQIMSFLGIRSVSRLSRVNKLFLEASKLPSFWRNLYTRKYPLSLKFSYLVCIKVNNLEFKKCQECQLSHKKMNQSGLIICRDLNNSHDWRNLLKEKILLEKEKARGKFNKKGYFYRVCPLAGCQTVFTSLNFSVVLKYF